jgi:Isocitrate dehydrogenases
MEDKSVLSFNGVPIPSEGEKVIFAGGKPVTVPNRPIIPFIEGDGIGPEISTAVRRMLDAAVKSLHGSKRGIVWYEIFAGEKAQAKLGNNLPQDTIDAIRHFGVAIKGPLGTPTGGGFRSLNVHTRKVLDLYQCVRPVRYFPGVASPLKKPENVKVDIFRENTEDVYAGIEYNFGTDEAQKIIDLVNSWGETLDRDDTAIAIKPMSKRKSKRIVRAAIKHALEKGLPSVTIVHKGNIQKYTEGNFRAWGYEVAAEFGDVICYEDEFKANKWVLPAGKSLLVNDRIADNMFCQMVMRPQDYSVLALPNLLGDLMSDLAAALIGGLGIAPGSNYSDTVGLHEATHGTAPDIAGQNKANPGSLLLSAAQMMRHIGWNAVADLIEATFARCIANKTVTGDLGRDMEGATNLGTIEFADAFIALLPEAPAEVAPDTVAVVADAPAGAKAAGEAVGSANTAPAGSSDTVKDAADTVAPVAVVTTHEGVIAVETGAATGGAGTDTSKT